MTRWEALVRFDDEIREAATKLIPFGSTWVDRLGEAFFALNEDRKYLPNIVARLTEEAALKALDAEQAASMEWLASLLTTKEGEMTSKEALTVLIELRARGYQIDREFNGIFAVKRSGRGTSYAYSNADILRLGSILLKESRER